MHIAVLGAGVVGLTTALALVERGHRVTIVDRQQAGGRETSFGNGAQLSYAFVEPLASKATLKKLPAMMFDRSGPLKVKWSPDPDFLRWGLAFLAACTDDMERATTHAQLDLAALSRAEMARITQAWSLSYGLREPGKLIVYRSETGVKSAARQAEAFGKLGIHQEVADPARCLEIEPALKFPKGALKGGLFTPTEQVASCTLFCDQLSAALQRSGQVTWRLGTTISAPVIEKRRLKAVLTTDDPIEADAFVLALGCGSAKLSRQAGFRLPIQPLKGYSLTIPTRAGAQPLNCSVTDADNKTVYAPLVNDGKPTVRVAGMAHLGNWNTDTDPASLESMRALASDLLDLDMTVPDQPWAGLRPATPSGRPIIGPSPVSGLYLNTGHGGLGWTLAAGSARLVSDIIDGVAPAIPAAPFSRPTGL